jgi:hypothetical protein
MPKRRADETVRLASAVNEKRRQAQRTPGSNPNPRQEVVQIDDSSPTSGEVNFQSNIILSAHVSQSIKEKIWCNNYIELQHLLPKVKPDSAGKQKIQFENGELILCPNEQSPKSLENIESWTDAFHIFIAIYILKHPDEIGNLLQYMANIRQAATRHIGWAAYDSSFRLKKSVNESLRWETIDPELWMLSMQPIQSVGLSITSPFSKKCFPFNNKGFCVNRNCSFAHKCIKCSGNHPALQCRINSKQIRQGPTYSQDASRLNTRPNRFSLGNSPTVPTVPVPSLFSSNRRFMGPRFNTN